nr:MAG TPA: hypothetical protein [Caudoviricetes sp.]
MCYSINYRKSKGILNGFPFCLQWNLITTVRDGNRREPEY